MEEKKIVLCDTDVMIEFFKGNDEVITNFKLIGQEFIRISIITAAELIFGAINKKDLQNINNCIDKIKQMDIVGDINARFLKLMNTCALSHKLIIPDAIIASTALENEIELYTYNIKDFKYIEGIKLYKTRGITH